MLSVRLLNMLICLKSSKVDRIIPMAVIASNRMLVALTNAKFLAKIHENSKAQEMQNTIYSKVEYKASLRCCFKLGSLLFSLGKNNNAWPSQLLISRLMALLNCCYICRN